MTTRQTPDAVRRLQAAWDGCGSLPPIQFSESEADAILAALDSRAGDAGEDKARTTISGHTVDCAWHVDQYPHECTCASATPAPAVDALEGDDEGPCTDCEDTGITIQTERACSCDAGDQYRPPAVDAVPAGEVERLVKQLSDEAGDWRHNTYTRVMLAQMRDRLSAALSHGEVR